MDHTLDPRKLKVTERQAKHLGKLARMEPRELVGKQYAELEELLRFRIDPELFLYRRICGRVIKKNPLTGEIEGVPNATVHVEDTDCSLVGYYPPGHPYFWLYMIRCKTEVLATVPTDECGRFCVPVPRWDIDRFLRWRLRWRCHFHRPRIVDLLPDLRPKPEPIPRPRPIDPIPRPIPRPFPLPDPPPFRLDRHALDNAEGMIDPQVARLLEQASDRGGLEAKAHEADEMLDLPLFPRRMAAPLPDKLQDVEAFRDALPLEPELAKHVHPRRVLGPFLRCHLEWVAEWQTFIDVPDLTFRVTQDTDGDGNEETIYSEGLFDVRWDDTTTSYVVLEADANAISVPCGGSPEEIPCQDKPSIEAVSSMDLETAFHDDATGYATRINQPHQPGDDFGSGARVMPATAPYCRWLKLYGCIEFEGVTHYRLLYKYKTDSLAAFGAEQPFVSEAWSAARQGPGAPIPFVPDAQGWYQKVDPADLVEPNWIFYWGTPKTHFADGIYEVRVELGQAGGGGIVSQGFSDPRTFYVENRDSSAQFLEVRWRHQAASPLPWSAAPVLNLNNCPVIERNAGQTIELRVQWLASAPHLRSAVLGAHGCGGGNPVPITALSTRRHWHTGPNDNTVSRTAEFELPGDRPPGCYGLSITAHGRQCNPHGANGGANLATMWMIDQHFGRRHVSRSISVVDKP